MILIIINALSAGKDLNRLKNISDSVLNQENLN